ncbi:hypothetical protein G7048_15490 [Diaphorobacter sp. HDW4B]|uniref:hypothetical protein n=1 Tax=Diaphorobacter sp. HDW4B TaxID=2714925 RepID=UPI0014094E65|nr:hypothetical protein [Diaphorobacter sp. HDW4B]QIL71632.1 hypothetical protein G7048_15490 [Diaphorobacter sp. HDW4B]
MNPRNVGEQSTIRPHPKEGRGKWTAQESSRLRELYPQHTARQIASMMSKPLTEVQRQATKLGLRKHNKGSSKHIGSERMDRGYLIRKVTDTGQPKKDWKRVELIEWEALNGPIPAGMMLMVKNPALPRTMDNLGLFTSQQHWERVLVQNQHPELRQLCQLKGQITQAINRRTSPKRKAP